MRLTIADALRRWYPHADLPEDTQPWVKTAKPRRCYWFCTAMRQPVAVDQLRTYAPYPFDDVRFDVTLTIKPRGNSMIFTSRALDEFLYTTKRECSEGEAWRLERLPDSPYTNGRANSQIWRDASGDTRTSASVHGEIQRFRICASGKRSNAS